MYPILNVGPAAIQLPGLVLLLGYWLGLSLAERRARVEGLPADAVFNAGMVALLAGLVGARLGYVALHWSAYRGDLGGVLALTTGALSTSVGLAVGLGAAALSLYRHRPPLPALLDALAPALALLFAAVSLADFCSGSAYGVTTDLPWAIQLWGARRHPTQIYELLAALATLGVLWRARRQRPYEGFLFLLFVLLYGALRLFLEVFRADPWTLPGGYRAVQVIGWGATVLALWLMRRRALASADAPHTSQR